MLQFITRMVKLVVKVVYFRFKVVKVF